VRKAAPKNKNSPAWMIFGRTDRILVRPRTCGDTRLRVKCWQELDYADAYRAALMPSFCRARPLA
jgi:hypothetical protein